MLDFSYRGHYHGRMDPECVDICNILNSLPGVETTESCCGHGASEFVVFFLCTDWRSISFLGRCTDRRYGGSLLLTVEVNNSDVNYKHACYILRTKDYVVGEDAYKLIRKLCQNARQHINNEAYVEMFMRGLPGFLIQEIDAEKVVNEEIYGDKCNSAAFAEIEKLRDQCNRLNMLSDHVRLDIMWQKLVVDRDVARMDAKKWEAVARKLAHKYGGKTPKDVIDALNWAMSEEPLMDPAS